MGVMIVDPDVEGSRFLTFILKAEGYDDVRTMCSGRDAVSHLAECGISLIVTEAHLSDTDGASLCGALRSRNFHGPIIVTSESNGILDRVRCLNAGADDFVGKPIDPSEFMARIAAVTNRYHDDDHVYSSRLLRVGDAVLSIRDLTLDIDGRPTVNLTPTELRLIECLMRNVGVAVSRDTLINRTWGYDLFGESNRLDVYMRRLRRKIEPDPLLPQYLVTVRTVGYAFHSRTSEFVNTARNGPIPFGEMDQVIVSETSETRFSDTPRFDGFRSSMTPDLQDVGELTG